MSKSSEIELKNISYLYGKNTPFENTALDNINLTIEKEIITGLIGHTGSGKSTLALLICGLLPPTSGNIYIGGEMMFAAQSEDVGGISRGGNVKRRKVKGAKKHNRESNEKMKFKTGIIFQYPEYQLFEETVYKDIAYGPTNMNLPEDEIRTRVENAAEFAGVTPDMFEKSPFDLSGGQKRRVAIAGVMAIDPEILILDEPAAGLDPRGREEILGGLYEYQKITKKTMIMISHSMEDMAKYAEKVIVLRDGRVFMYDTVGEVFKKSELLIESRLSVPQITKLFIELKRRGVNVPDGIYKTEDAKDEVIRLLGRKDGGK